MGGEWVELVVLGEGGGREEEGGGGSINVGTDNRLVAKNCRLSDTNSIDISAIKHHPVITPMTVKPNI